MPKKMSTVNAARPWYWLAGAAGLLILALVLLTLTDTGQKIGTRSTPTPSAAPEQLGACYPYEAPCRVTTRQECVEMSGGFTDEADAVFDWHAGASCPSGNACMRRGAETFKVYSDPFLCNDLEAERAAFSQCEDELFALGKLSRLCQSRSRRSGETCTAELLFGPREFEVADLGGNQQCQAVCRAQFICRAYLGPTSSSEADPTTTP